MIHTRICKECHGLYDIGTNFDTCPRCRLKAKEEKRKQCSSQ